MSTHQKTSNESAVKKLEVELKPLFNDLFALQIQIREKLANYADEKSLKGYEIVGWLGEIYVKLLFDGHLVDDELALSARHVADCESCHKAFVEELRRRVGAGPFTFSLEPEFVFRDDHFGV